MRTTMLIVARMGSLAAVVAGFVAGPAAAMQADPSSPVALQVTAGETSYRPGASVPLKVVVANHASTACGLLAAADGAVHVVAATRDGKPLTPSFSRELPINGAAAAFDQGVQVVAANAAVSFTLDAGGPQGMPVVIPQRDGSDLTASWPTSQVGTYRLTLVYQVPPLAGTGVCQSASNQATVVYTVSAASPGPPWRWIIAGIAALIVIGLVIAVIVLLRRRSRGHRVTATAVVVTLLLAGLAGGVVHAPSAQASVTYNSGTDTARAAQERGCINEIAAIDPGLLNSLTGPGSPDVEIYPWIYSSREDLASGKPQDSFIRWDNEDKGHIPGEAPGVNYDPCSELYHELIHALDASMNKLSDALCDDTGVLNDEVRATIAENYFRSKLKPKLPPRKTYDLKKIPTSMAGCTPPTKKAPPAGHTRRCNATQCAITNGDPHLTTFDGVRYDFQAVGEFTAVTSSAGDFDVQVRQSAYPNTRTVAVNTAIAIQVGATRLGFYLTNGTIAVHRDRVPTTLAIGDTALPGGATIAHVEDPISGEEYDVTWADGTVVALWRASVWGLVATITPAPARKGTLSGLLGDFDGDKTNDVTVHGGAALAEPTMFDELYPKFADSWRITDAESLFDYAAGQSTATFTDRTFPSRPESFATLDTAQRKAATAACQQAGVTNIDDLNDCILDVALTGQADFAFSADDVQAISAQSSSGPIAAAQTSTLTVTTPGKTSTFTFAGTKGQKVYVDVPSATVPDSCGVLSLLGPGDAQLGSGCIVGGNGYIDAVILPTTGQYRVVLSPPSGTGHAQIRVITAIDQQGTITEGGDATATISQPGATSTLTFAASAGQKVYVDVPSASLPTECGVLSIDAPDSHRLESGCIIDGTGYIDGTVLPASGTYRIVIDPERDRTGTAQIHLSTATDQSASTTVGAAAVSMTIAQPGAISTLSFPATAGQKLAVDISSTSSQVNTCGVLSLVGPDGSTLGSGCVINGTGQIDPISLPASGTYHLVFDLGANLTGSIKVHIHTT